MSSSKCNICSKEIGSKNRTVFDCGHTFHLSCVMSSHFNTLCSDCPANLNTRPDLGNDREIVMNADMLMKISERRLKPAEDTSVFHSIVQAITPLTPAPMTFIDHMKQNKKLTVLASCGFGPEDAVQERVRFSDIVSRYNSKDILEFGFDWDHMVQMGILPTHLAHFSWTQQIHKLKLNAAKMLKMRMTMTELTDLKYTTHQLVELGFTWQILTTMGANVDTWKRFNFELEDIKRYWQPTLTQWVAAGFYDKQRVQRAGWQMETVITSLPAMDQRASGRVLRLAF